MDEIKVFYPEDFKDPKPANVWRIFPKDEQYFTVEFGFKESQDGIEEIKVVSSNNLEAGRFKDFVFPLLFAAITYEKEYKKDLGLGLKQSSDNEQPSK